MYLFYNFRIVFVQSLTVPFLLYVHFSFEVKRKMNQKEKPF